MSKAYNIKIYMEQTQYSVFAIIYSYLSELEGIETQSTSPAQTSIHTKVRNEIAAFSAFLNSIRESFTSNNVSQYA